VVRTNTYLSKEENDIIESYSEKWKIGKEETIKRIIREFKEEY